MAFEVRKAQRRKAKLRLGLVGPSGSGKTLSALLVAYGLVKAAHPDWSDEQIWETVGLIDTEEGSGELYQGKNVSKHGITIGEYLYTRFDPPFSPERYIDAIRAMENAGAEVIIVDSLSHAWAGTGGVLDIQGKVAAKEGNSYTAWRHVTPQHNALVDKLLRTSAHLVCTLRAKTEYVIETNERGKQVPRKVGLAPVQRDGLEYEFTTVLDVSMEHIASASKDRTGVFEGQFVLLGPDAGKAIYEWLESGAEASPLPQQRGPSDSEKALFLAAGKPQALQKALTNEKWDEAVKLYAPLCKFTSYDDLLAAAKRFGYEGMDVDELALTHDIVAFEEKTHTPDRLAALWKDILAGKRAPSEV